MSDHSARFKRWSSRLPNHASYLVDRVEQSVVPILMNAGFAQAPAAYGSSRKGMLRTSAWPFQIRAGAGWPTAEIFFCPHGRPWFRIELAWLVNGLTDRDGNVFALEHGVLHDAPEYFEVAKEQGTVRELFSQFGYHWWSPLPRRKLDAEVAAAARALAQALPVFLNMATAPAHPPADPSERYVANTLIRVRVPGQQATSSTRFVRPNE